MGSIVLLDTSVYLNVLDVPDCNQDRDSVLDEFTLRIEDEDRFLLPMAAIWETGNHISNLRSGKLRRQFAQKLVDNVTDALKGNAPYWPTYFPDREEFFHWLGEFPKHALRSKSAEKAGEGVSLADMSIIMEWQRLCDLHKMSRVLIWSLDADLAGYDRKVS